MPLKKITRTYMGLTLTNGHFRDSDDSYLSLLKNSVIFLSPKNSTICWPSRTKTPAVLRNNPSDPFPANISRSDCLSKVGKALKIIRHCELPPTADLLNVHSSIYPTKFSRESLTKLKQSTKKVSFVPQKDEPQLRRANSNRWAFQML